MLDGSFGNSGAHNNYNNQHLHGGSSFLGSGMGDGNDYDMVMQGSGDAHDDEELNMSGQFSPPHEPEGGAHSRFADDAQHMRDERAAAEHAAEIDSPYADQQAMEQAFGA